MDPLTKELLALVSDLRAEVREVREELRQERAKAEEVKTRSAGAERQKRYRERNALRNGDVTSDASCDAPLPPPDGPPPSAPCTPTSPPPLKPPLNPAHVHARVEDAEIPFADGSPAIDLSQIDLSEEVDNVGPTGLRKAPKPSDKYTADFEAWWALYPRKVSKDEAFKLWKRLLGAGKTLEELTEGLKRWLVSSDWADAEPKHIPHPATWLSKKRFDDHPPAASSPKPTLSILPDLPATPPLPVEFEGEPWFSVLSKHIGSNGPTDLAVMNFAYALGVEDVHGVAQVFKRDGIKAAGDLAWSRRRA